MNARHAATLWPDPTKKKPRLRGAGVTHRTQFFLLFCSAFYCAFCNQISFCAIRLVSTITSTLDPLADIPPVSWLARPSPGGGFLLLFWANEGQHRISKARASCWAGLCFQGFTSASSAADAAL
jgi:hypothetical protein